MNKSLEFLEEPTCQQFKWHILASAKGVLQASELGCQEVSNQVDQMADLRRKSYFCLYLTWLDAQG